MSDTRNALADKQQDRRNRWALRQDGEFDSLRAALRSARRHGTLTDVETLEDEGAQLLEAHQAEDSDRRALEAVEWAAA